MTRSQIEKRQTQENVRYELAKQIRDLLDAARKNYGSQDWQDDGIEEAVQELVFGE